MAAFSPYEAQQYSAAAAAMQQQQQAMNWTNLTNFDSLVTTTSGTAATGIDATSFIAQNTSPAAPAEPPEIAWLKRRVREIEWRKEG